MMGPMSGKLKVRTLTLQVNENQWIMMREYFGEMDRLVQANKFPMHPVQATELKNLVRVIEECGKRKIIP